MQKEKVSYRKLEIKLQQHEMALAQLVTIVASTNRRLKALEQTQKGSKHFVKSTQ